MYIYLEKIQDCSKVFVPERQEIIRLMIAGDGIKI